MNQKFTLSRTSSIFLVLATLAACGGNSGGGSSSASPPPDNSTGSQRPSSVAGFVYALNREGGDISAYAINSATGMLSDVPESPFVTGDNPLDIAVGPSGRFLYVTSSVSKDVTAYTIDDATGALAEIAGGPYPVGDFPGSFSIDPSGKFGYVVAGGRYSILEGHTQPFWVPGKIWGFTINATTGALTPIAGSPFDAPENRKPLIFDRAGRFAYASGGYGYPSTPDSPPSDHPGNVTTFAIDAATGALTQVGAPTNANGWDSDAVMIAPSGKFAYSANAGNISSYRIDTATGALSLLGTNAFTLAPSHVGSIHPSGKFIYVANYFTEWTDPSEVAVFAIDATTGLLTQVTGSPFTAGNGMTSFNLAPTGKVAYATHRPPDASFPGTVSAYGIDAATGSLSEVAGGIAGTGSDPSSAVVDPSGRVAYVMNTYSQNISAYTLNSATGAPTNIGTVPTGRGPWEIVITGIR